MQEMHLTNWRRNILDKYNVKLYKRAYRDIEDIYSYIANEKISSQIAKGQTSRIKAAVLGLDTFPQSHQERQVGKYANKGYRQLLIDNYVAIYKIDEKKKIVYVVTVQYQGRDV